MAFDRDRHYPSADVEEIDFTSFAAWNAFLDEAKRDVGNVADHTELYGLYEPITLRHFPPEKIYWDRKNLRETGLTQGISSRVRAILYALHSCVGDINKFDIKIYAAEAITDFALLLRGYFPKFIGSEYTDDERVAADL